MRAAEVEAAATMIDSPEFTDILIDTGFLPADEAEDHDMTWIEGQKTTT
jgi:hypothetical protein